MRKFLELSFERGVDYSFDPTRIPPGMGVAIRNWLPHADGSLRARSGWKVMGTTGTPPTDHLSGALVTDNDPAGLFVYERETNILYKNTSAIGNGTWSVVDDLAGTGPASVVMPIVNGAGFIVWGAAGYNSDKLRKWDGTTASDASTNVLGGSALAYHKNRFWTIAASPDYNRLYWSGIDDPNSWNKTTDFIALPGLPASTAAGALAPFLDGLLIGRRDGIWFLTGDGPSNFALHTLDGGDAASGQSIIGTPYGAIIAGGARVFIWTGGGPVVPFEQLRRGVEGAGYTTSVYSTVAYYGGRVYICVKDLSDADNLWVWDPRSRVWSTEDYVSGSEEEIHMIANGPENLVGLTEGTAGTGNPGTAEPLVSRSDRDNEDGDRDAEVAEKFYAKTGALPLGDVASPATLLHLHMLLRQRNGDAGDVGMTVTPWIDGTELSVAKTIGPKASPQVFRDRVDFTPGTTGFTTQIELEHALTTSDEATFDILRSVLEYDVEAPR